MRAEPYARRVWATLVLLLALSGPQAGQQVQAAEAPPGELAAADAVLPLPPEAEAAHQDLRGGEGVSYSASGRSMDEAVFTEISPLTVPEIGIHLPEDQDH